MNKLPPLKPALLCLALGVSCASQAEAGKLPIMTYRGEWSAAANYDKGAVVVLNDSAYVSQRNNRGVRPGRNAGAGA